MVSAPRKAIYRVHLSVGVDAEGWPTGATCTVEEHNKLFSVADRFNETERAALYSILREALARLSQ